MRVCLAVASPEPGRRTGWLRWVYSRDRGAESDGASARVRPARLLDHGFQFLFPELTPALRHLLKPGTY